MNVYILSTTSGHVLGAYTTRGKAEAEARRLGINPHVISRVIIDRPA